MEPADIDWKNVESRYVQDEVYEHINAPKWLDLAAPDALAVDDDAWFCRPDCRHPKTAEDFQRWTPSPKVKLLRSNSEALQRNNNNHRDASLKRRGVMASLLPSSPLREPTKPRAAPKKFRDDLENRDPNICSTPPLPGRPLAAPGKTAKDAIKSSMEKRDGDKGKEECQQRKTQPPRLRSTLSARNLFSGKDILGQISEFCNELKKLAMRKERNPGGEGEAKKEEEEKKALLEVEEEQERRRDLNLNLNNSKRNDGSMKKSSRLVVRVETEKEKCKKGGDENSSVLREVRAWPPTPQRFPSPSSHRPRKAKASATTNSPLNKPPKSTAPERGVLQEMDQQIREEKRALVAKDEDCNRAAADSPNVEGRSEGVFWFLKPCSYLV